MMEMLDTVPNIYLVRRYFTVREGELLDVANDVHGKNILSSTLPDLVIHSTACAAWLNRRQFFSWSVADVKHYPRRNCRS